MRNTAHVMLCTVRKRKVQESGNFISIRIEHFIKITKPKEQHLIRMLCLQALIRGKERCFFSHRAYLSLKPNALITSSVMSTEELYHRIELLFCELNTMLYPSFSAVCLMIEYSLL